MVDQMYEQKLFETAIRKAYSEIRDSNRKRLYKALQNALPLLSNVKDVEFDYLHMHIQYIGRRSFIAYDEHIYALLHGMNLSIIHKSFSLGEIWPYFMEVESNE